MKRAFPYLALIGGLAALDQITKFLVASRVGLYRSFSVIPGFFNITHIHNSGAIFGFLSNSHKLPVFLLLTGSSFLALGFVIFYFIKTPASERFVRLSLALILAGALGNLIDRLGRGYVIDFLEFYHKSWSFPSFNVADSCITIGAILLVLASFRRKQACTPSS
jgi:signal peptidase II